MIKTKRLVLKPYEDKDKDNMFELLTNEEIKKNYMIPDYECEDELQLMFEKIKKFSYCDDHYERGIYLESNLIGFINDVESDEDTIELGYVIHPKYHNLGYASEVLKASIEYLFKKGFKEVITGAFINNKASIRVMEKCKMKRISRHENITYHNEVRECVYYSIKG